MPNDKKIHQGFAPLSPQPSPFYNQFQAPPAASPPLPVGQAQIGPDPKTVQHLRSLLEDALVEMAQQNGDEAMSKVNEALTIVENL